MHGWSYEAGFGGIAGYGDKVVRHSESNLHSVRTDHSQNLAIKLLPMVKGPSCSV
jgi:hypothetical protein